MVADKVSVSFAVPVCSVWSMNINWLFSCSLIKIFFFVVFGRVN